MAEATLAADPAADTSSFRNPNDTAFPGRVQAVGGDDPAAFIMHHTGGRGTIADLQKTLQERGLGVEYAMDRDGNIYQIGAAGAQNIQTGWGPKGKGLSNKNVVGMEIIAKDDSDLTDAQKNSAARFIAARYPNTPVLGHGEVNPGHKEADEGRSASEAALSLRSKLGGGGPSLADNPPSGAIQKRVAGPGDAPSGAVDKGPLSYQAIFEDAEAKNGLPHGLLSAIARQENVAPGHNNPLGLSNDAGVLSFSPQDAAAHIYRQAKLLKDPNGPYADFAKSGSIDDLAKVWSPVGAPNDIKGTNATEAAGIKANMGKGYSGTLSAEVSNPTSAAPNRTQKGVTGLGVPASEEAAAQQKTATQQGKATAQQEPESTEPPPFQAVPSNPVKNVNQIRQQALENGEDPDEAVANAHSEAVADNPDDNRVAQRTNPDTGSIRMVGNYFVPGDEHHAELLSEMDPLHQAKLPAISQAINRGGPFSFMYGSAPQEGGAAQWEGEAPTGESRGYEQAMSPAQQRIAGGETQQEQVMMLPAQLVAEGKPGNRSVSLEGFGSQQAINNARNIIGGANAAKIPVPYDSHTNPKFQNDLMGFLENQANGYRGDGSGPVLDESGNPHKSFRPETGYVPHLLQKPEAEFIHAALNIRPGKNKMSPGPAPSFRERAQWIRRINEAYAGHQAGQNTLLDKLDSKLPQVGVRGKLTEKMKRQGITEAPITRYVPWSHARGTLEATWRKYRPELMSHLGMPPIGSHSMRELAGAHMVHRHPVYRQHVAEFQEHPPAPIAGNPEVGAPLGAGEKLASAAIHYTRSGKTYAGKGHYEATQAAMQAGEPHPWREMENGSPVHRGYLTNKGRFITDTELYAPKPAPIAQNPEVGGPAGTPNAPGESGLLAGDQPQTEQETGPAAQATQEPPPLPDPRTQAGIDFASPNIRDDMSFNTAKKALKGKEHARVRDYGDRLENKLASEYGYQPAPNIDTIGDYQETAENTMMTPHVGHLQAHRRLVQALKGLHGGQKQVLSFRHDPQGEHYLYSLKFNHDKAETVRDLLDKQKIKYRTFEPAVKGQPVGVHIVDFDGSIEPKLTKLFQKGHIGDAHAYRGNAELIGDENSRERAAQAYRGVLQEARDQAAQGFAGRSGLHGGQAWFEPYAREAEENFQRLRQLDEFEKQEIANDHREAGEDRDEIPPDQTRELKRLNRIGKGLVANDPSMAELDPRSNHAYILGQKQFPRTDMKNADVGEFFDKEHPRLDLINSADDREKAAHIYFQDLIHSIAGTARGGKPSTAYGWYDRTVRKTIKKMAKVAPEILEDPDHELAFKLALAVTSQGQEVNPNAESSWHAYQYWKKHGKFPESVSNFGDGQKYVQMEQNFKKLNELWNGTEEKPGMSTAELRRLLTEKTTVGKLKEEHGLTVAGENVKHVVRGAMGLGPKVGAFFSNLMGHFDPVTMDMWWSRDLNKAAGNMFNFSEDSMRKGTSDYGPQVEELAKMLGMESKSDHPKLEGREQLPALTPPGEGEGHVPRHEGMLAATPEEMAKMRDEIKALRAIPAGKMDRPNVLAAAPTVYQWAKKATRNYARSYGEEEGDRKRSFHPDFKTPENSLGKRMWENVNKLSDAPRGAAERHAWREVTSLVEKKLLAHGIRLTNADKQALGWFNIKDVFALAGANAVRNADYLDAAYTLTRRIKNGNLADLTNE